MFLMPRTSTIGLAILRELLCLMLPVKSSPFSTVLQAFDWDSAAFNLEFIFSGFRLEDLGNYFNGRASSFTMLPSSTAMTDTQDLGYQDFTVQILKMPAEDIIEDIHRRPGAASKHIYIIDSGENQSADEMLQRITKDLRSKTVAQLNDVDSNVYIVFVGHVSVGTNQTSALNYYGRSSEVQVFEIYAIKSNIFVRKIEMTEGRVNFADLQQEKVHRRGDFKGIEVAAAAQRSPYSDSEVRFRDGSNTTLAEFEDGVAVDMYRNLRYVLNFTEKALVGSSIGLQNGKISGRTYELLENGTADISISQITVKLERAEVLQYLQPTLASARIQAIFKQPKLSHMRNIFFAPFTLPVWNIIAITWLVLVALMMVFSLLLARYDRMKESADQVYIQDACLCTYAALCQKGWTSPPASISLRSLFFTACLTGFILYVSYSAVILATLSVEQLPVKGIEDLVKFKYKFYAHELSYTMQKFVQAAIVQKYNLSQPILTTNTENEVKMLIKSTKVLVSYLDVFYSAIKTQNYTVEFLCKRISKIPIDSEPQKMAMFVKKGSPFREYFDYGIIKMKERGFIARCLKTYWRNTEPGCGTLKSAVEKQELDLQDVYVAFALLAGGGAVSILVALVERFVSFRNNIAVHLCGAGLQGN